MLEFNNHSVHLDDTSAVSGGVALVARDTCILAPFEIFNNFEDIWMCFFNRLKSYKMSL